MSSANDNHVTQSGNMPQNRWNTQNSYFNPPQNQHGVENAYYQQRHPSYKQHMAQNLIPTNQWPQVQTTSLNVNYGRPHMIQNTQLHHQYQSMMAQNHTIHHQLTSSNSNHPTSKFHAQTSFASKPKCGNRAVLKPIKRKRTMFTTEQKEFLESYFSNKSYVTRDDRLVLVKLLNVSDSAIKVWFQNRRIRSKRDHDQSAEEDDSGISSENSPLFPTTFTSTSDTDTTPDLDKILQELCKNRPWKNENTAEIEEILHYPVQSVIQNQTLSSKLDEIEYKINQQTNEFGIVYLDEILMSEIVSFIDQALPQNLDINDLLRELHQEKTNIHEEKAAIKIEREPSQPEVTPAISPENKIFIETKTTETVANQTQAEIIGVINDREVRKISSLENIGYCHLIDNGCDTENNTCTVAMYEPISPAESVEEGNINVNKKSIPRDKLQEIFNRVFC